MNALPKTVRMVEVGPRDGLQNEKNPIDTATKVTLIEKLVDTGLNYIEAGSFVNPKWVPQMAGSDDVFKSITRKKNTTYAALTPNLKGFERAMQAGATEVAIFAAASESFSQKNINCSIAESLDKFIPLIQSAKQKNIAVRGYISCVSGCPYEGEIKTDIVRDIAHTLMEMGCYEVSLGDTIGVATPGKFSSMIQQVASKVPVEKLAIHCHDTYGQALANIYAALQLGVNVIDSSVAGLGGCPYAKGASGNVASEDVLYMLQGLEIETGVNLDKLITTGHFICSALQRENGSRVGKAKQKCLEPQ